MVAAPQSTKKLNPSYAQSKSISFYFELVSNHRIKVLFDESCSNEIWGEKIDEMLDLVEDHHAHYPDDTLSRLISENDLHRNREIYAVINKGSLDWTFLDLKKIVEQQMKQASEVNALNPEAGQNS